MQNTQWKLLVIMLIAAIAFGVVGISMAQDDAEEASDDVLFEIEIIGTVVSIDDDIVVADEDGGEVIIAPAGAFNPSDLETFGSQPSIFFAFSIFGCRCFGSSCGSGLYTTFCVVPVNFTISSAKSPMVISFGLPMFIGK